jgi:hypothetical protein
MRWKVRLQVAAFLAGVVGSAALGIWGSIHFDNPAWLLLCIPAFAAVMAGGA